MVPSRMSAELREGRHGAHGVAVGAVVHGGDGVGVGRGVAPEVGGQRVLREHHAGVAG